MHVLRHAGTNLPGDDARFPASICVQFPFNRLALIMSPSLLNPDQMYFDMSAGTSIPAGDAH